MSENTLNSQPSAAPSGVERATQALQQKMTAFQGSTSTPETPATTGETVTEVAKAIIGAAQGKAPPEGLREPPKDTEAVNRERYAQQERRLLELRARTAAKRAEEERQRTFETKAREAESRAQELADREAKLKEKEETWKKALTDPIQGFANLGMHPETAFDQIAKTMSGRNQKVELTSAQWDAVQAKIAELETKTTAKPEIDPDFKKQFSEMQEKLRAAEEANENANMRQLRAQKEHEFVGTVKSVAPELLVEYGDRLLIRLADQLADAWTDQGIRGWKFDDLALELKNQHDAHEQAKAERRAQLAPAARSPSQSAGNSAPPVATSASPSGRFTATQTLTNDLSSSNGAAAETKLSAKERERRATERLQAKMNSQR